MRKVYDKPKMKRNTIVRDQLGYLNWEPLTLT